MRLSLAAIALALLEFGCVPIRLLRMDPLPAPSQATTYRNGTGAIYSVGQRFDVAVSPATDSVGQYQLRDRVGFVVALRNKSGGWVEVSERGIEVIGRTVPRYRADAGGMPPAETMPIVPATLRAKEIRSEAAAARVSGAFAHASSTLVGGRDQAGTTHFRANVTGPGGEKSQVTGTTYSADAAEAARRAERAEEAAENAAIREDERSALAQLSAWFQRNTVEPGAIYGGQVLAQRPAEGGCAAYRVRASLACQITVKVRVSGEEHVVVFMERD